MRRSRSNFSVGAVLRFGELDITIDAYRIDIDDRIVLSENLTSAAVRDFLTQQGFIGVGGGRFFINGVDTQDRGRRRRGELSARDGRADASTSRCAANFNSTEVDKVPQTPQLGGAESAAGAVRPPQHPDVRGRHAGGQVQPRTSTGASTRLGATLRATRYGEVFSPDSAATFATVAAGRGRSTSRSAKTLVDLEGALRHHGPHPRGDRRRQSHGRVSGSEPTPMLNPTGTQSFSNYSPFGRSGRFVYGRLSYKF